MFPSATEIKSFAIEMAQGSVASVGSLVHVIACFGCLALPVLHVHIVVHTRLQAQNMYYYFNTKLFILLHDYLHI